MKFTDLFIHRPVLATVVSLLILLLGLRSATLVLSLLNAVVAVGEKEDQYDFIHLFLQRYPELNSLRLNTIQAGLAQSVTRIPVLEESLERSRHRQEQLNAVNLSLEKKLSELTTRLDAEHRQAPDDAEERPAPRAPQADQGEGRVGARDEQEDGGMRYIAGSPNFYAITRWNNSSRYAMVIAELAEEFKK